MPAEMTNSETSTATSLREDSPFIASDGARIQRYRWLADKCRAVIHISHGMGEHAARYDRIASALADAGFTVYANDHRGHGLTAPPGQQGWLGEDGWNRLITDLREMIRAERKTHPGVPVVLFGHSMGSMASQQYICRYGKSIDAVVLSGSPGFSSRFQSFLSRTIARFERWRLGADADSELLQGLLFGKSNEPFDGDAATGFEWLSRDRTEVQKYIDDPLCGAVLTAGSLVDLFQGARRAADPAIIAAIPEDLPAYVFSGSEDPVHGEEKNLSRLLARYRDRMSNVTYRLYPGGRHEMLNETNRDEVTKDLIAWLNETIS